MLRRQFLSSVAIVASAFLNYPAAAQDTVKIGLIVPMTGQQASTGKQIDAAVKLYHGSSTARRSPARRSRSSSRTTAPCRTTPSASRRS